MLGNRIQAVNEQGVRLESKTKELGVFVGGSGKVGIGRTMNNPQERLHVQGVKSDTKVIIKDVSKSVLKVIMMAKLEQILNLE